MLRKQFIFKVFVVSIMLVACRANNTPPSIKGLILPSRCTNACWTGVEPEVTNKEQALSILTKKYGVENVDSENFDNQTRFINWMANQQDLSVGGTVSLIDNAVEDIIVRLKEEITVDELIESIGDPTFVNVVIAASSEVNCAGAVLLYPESGLQVYLLPNENSVGVYQSQYIDSLRIMKPWNRDELPWTDSANFSWDGYREYCPESWPWEK